jgi:hypothetical protein
MARVAQYYLTGRDVRPDGSTEVLAAHEYGPLVLEYEYWRSLCRRQDLEPVRAVLRAHLYEDKKAEAEASLGLNEVQKRETLELMDTTCRRRGRRLRRLRRSIRVNWRGCRRRGG